MFTNIVPFTFMCVHLGVCVCVVFQIEKGKLHGSIDVGLSVMAIKKKSKCIDLDAEDNIYHLKVNLSRCPPRRFTEGLYKQKQAIQLAAGC